MAITTNPIVDALRPANSDGEDVVTFNGWLAAGRTDTKTYRLFFDPRLTTYLEIPAGNVLQQLDGIGGASTIWVTAGAPVKKCQIGSAHSFAEDTDELDALAATQYPKK